MFWYATIIDSIVSFSRRLNRLVASWMLPALSLSSDEFFPFRYRLSCILAYLFFQHFPWALASASDAFKLLRGAIVIRTHHHIHKNLYYTFFANHIWSLLICSPVIFSSKYSGLIGSIFYQVCLQPLGSGFHFVCR